MRKYQNFCFPFSVHVLWPEGSTGGRFRPGTDRARGHHKARVTFKRSSELFNPKHKTMRQTQNGIPFQKSPPLMFVPTLCLLDNCLQSVLKLYTVPTCGAQHSPKKQNKKNPTTFVYEPTTSRSHQHIWNSIKRSKLDLHKEITLHIHALETFWLTVCEFSNVIKRRQLEVCGGGNGHRDNYPTCKNGL